MTLNETAYEALHSKTPTAAYVQHFHRTNTYRVVDADGCTIQFISKAHRPALAAITKLVAGWERRRVSDGEVAFLNPALPRDVRFSLMIEYAEMTHEQDVSNEKWLLQRKQSETMLQIWCKRERLMRDVRDAVRGK